MGRKKRGETHAYTKEILVFEREKKKQTYLREEAGMSFTLPLHIKSISKNTCAILYAAGIQSAK